MQNRALKDYLLVAVLSLLVAVLMVVAFVSFHFVPYKTVVY
jgi:ABC-type transporter Mla subunit MlaD